jgi:hypothetical protein
MSQISNHMACLNEKRLQHEESLSLKQSMLINNNNLTKTSLKCQ